MSTEILSSPSTPTRPSRYHYASSASYQPADSSPLVSSSPSSPPSSPGAEAHSRRRAQYKPLNAISYTAPRAHRSQRRKVTVDTDPFAAFSGSAAAAAATEEAPRKAFLRERFRARCLERAQKDRERKIEGRRRALSEAISDGDDEVMADDEDDEDFINDELFRRLVVNGRRKQQHQYRLSYSHEVGSSYDPAIEDITEWELDDEPEVLPPIDTTPEDLDQEELAAYAEECDIYSGDINTDELFSLSDMEDFDAPEERHEQSNSQKTATVTETDIEMVF
ncbi:hypothetical protein WOLCODRAFT_165489 [Wolfiporia cocos MD-104 SS10]|uniref:Uncharacterized protein n=1 Tax=Wolfiporia cocos (strain MD-104) TaxID=742152 RepID=A0A2H3JSJ4_WOLCO|nr:hypothetical protein WOLCODRAFT_165489 [Wolfiporia cocos MD-104 SS10]